MVGTIPRIILLQFILLTHFILIFEYILIDAHAYALYPVETSVSVN